MEASTHSSSASRAPALSCGAHQTILCRRELPACSGAAKRSWAPNHPPSQQKAVKFSFSCLGRVEGHELAGVWVDERRDEAPDDAPPVQHRIWRSRAVSTRVRGLQVRGPTAASRARLLSEKQPFHLPAGRIDEEGFVQAARVVQVQQRARLAAEGGGRGKGWVVARSGWQGVGGFQDGTVQRRWAPWP